MRGNNVPPRGMERGCVNATALASIVSSRLSNTLACISTQRTLLQNQLTRALWSQEKERHSYIGSHSRWECRAARVHLSRMSQLAVRISLAPLPSDWFMRHQQPLASLSPGQFNAVKQFAGAWESLNPYQCLWRKQTAVSCGPERCGSMMSLASDHGDLW